MKYTINEYRQGVDSEKLKIDLIETSNQLGNVYLSYEKYYKTSTKKYSLKTFTSRFGSWIRALAAANLKTTRDKEDAKRILDKDLLNELCQLAKQNMKDTITTTEYKKSGMYSKELFIIRFGSWANALKQAGLNGTGFIGKISDEELFHEIERIWTRLGRQPTTTDMRRPNTSRYSLDAYLRRFGGWRNALIAFLSYIESPSPIDDPVSNSTIPVPIEKNKVSLDSQPIKRTPRSINLRLRFTVLQKNNFSCCACGMSPAKDPNVELHIDHIVPWSRGGETVLTNLQVLCSKCNLGKGNTLSD